MTNHIESIDGKSREILDQWLHSCTRRRKISRNTIAVGLVVLDHLREHCPSRPDDVISKGGEVRGSRSGLAKILEAYGLQASYLKEVTTRQAHQDAQRLLEALHWGRELFDLSAQDRDELLLRLASVLVEEAREQLSRKCLDLHIDRSQEPTTWIRLILEAARERSGGVVEQHLIGAKLARRFPCANVANYPAHAADRQSGREGDFTLAEFVYHVTATPSRPLMQKCAENIRSGLHPIVLVPSHQENRASILADEEGIGEQLTVIPIETFVAINLIELATAESKELFIILQEIVAIYNDRLRKAETDLSLQIEVR